MNVAAYSKAILAIVAAAVTALLAATTDGVVTISELVNVGVAIVTALGVYLIPNLPGQITGYAKAIAAFAGAGLVALVSVLGDGAVTPDEWLQVALAALAGVGVTVVPNHVIVPADAARHLAA